MFRCLYASQEIIGRDGQVFYGLDEIVRSVGWVRRLGVTNRGVTHAVRGLCSIVIRQMSVQMAEDKMTEWRYLLPQSLVVPSVH